MNICKHRDNDKDICIVCLKKNCKEFKDTTCPQCYEMSMENVYYEARSDCTHDSKSICPLCFAGKLVGQDKKNVHKFANFQEFTNFYYDNFVNHILDKLKQCKAYKLNYGNKLKLYGEIIVLTATPVMDPLVRIEKHFIEGNKMIRVPKFKNPPRQDLLSQFTTYYYDHFMELFSSVDEYMEKIKVEKLKPVKTFKTEEKYKKLRDLKNSMYKENKPMMVKTKEIKNFYKRPFKEVFALHKKFDSFKSWAVRVNRLNGDVKIFSAIPSDKNCSKVNNEIFVLTREASKFENLEPEFKEVQKIHEHMLSLKDSYLELYDDLFVVSAKINSFIGLTDPPRYKNITTDIIDHAVKYFEEKDQQEKLKIFKELVNKRNNIISELKNQENRILQK